MTTNVNRKMNEIGLALILISILPAVSIFSNASPLYNLITATLLSFIGASLYFNKGSKWIINALSVKEPLIFATGIGLLSLNPYMTPNLWIIPIIGGFTLTFFALITRYTTIIDL